MSKMEKKYEKSLKKIMPGDGIFVENT